MVKDQVLTLDTVSTVEEAISEITAGGTTDIRQGILTVLNLLNTFEDTVDCRSHELFLLSDGDRNPGEHGANVLVQLLIALI